MFNRGAAEIKQIESASEAFRQRTMSVLRLAFLSSAVLEFFGAVSIAVLAIYFGFSFLGHLNFGHYGHAMSLFSGLFILMLAPEFFQPLRDLGSHYHAKAQAIGAAEELKALLDYQVTDAQGLTAENTQNQSIKDIDWHSPISLQADKLCVYSHDGIQLVGPLSFTINKGEQVALVGPSGSGKTSLLNALLGFLPYQGSLTINGVQLKYIDKGQWRQHLAWLGQDPQLFHGSIAENVALGDPALSTQKIQDCLQKAAILDFVKTQPLGLQHVIGEQMTGLSVGQAQRIALARALAQDAQLFLLDEPTASLDQHSEQAVFSALRDATAQSASLMVTHRLNQLQHMQQIWVLDKGLIVQQGNFAALNQSAGLFNSMQQDEAEFDMTDIGRHHFTPQKNNSEEQNA